VTSLDNLPIQWAAPLAVVRLPGEVDICNADQIRDTLLAVLNRGITTLVVDMTGTTFCGCAGTSAVARACQRATANRARVRVAIATPVVRRVFAITGVDRLVSIFESVDAAVGGRPTAPATTTRALPGMAPLRPAAPARARAARGARAKATAGLAARAQATAAPVAATPATAAPTEPAVTTAPGADGTGPAELAVRGGGAS
jgi:anti-sigma B factor antagonist